MDAAVFIDRDNTLIHSNGDLGDPDGVRLIQGAASAISSLCGLGYRIVVITNQGGVARGRFKVDDVEAVNRRIGERLARAANGARIDAFYYCPFHPEGRIKRYSRDHPTRKPKPGMLLAAARELDLDLARSWTVGDQIRDVQAGAAAGTRTILIGPEAESVAGAVPPRSASGGSRRRGVPDYTAESLIEAVRIIAQKRKPDAGEREVVAVPVTKKWDAAAVAKLQRVRSLAGDDEDSDGAAVATAPAEAPADAEADAAAEALAATPTERPVEASVEVRIDPLESVPSFIPVEPPVAREPFEEPVAQPPGGGTAPMDEAPAEAAAAGKASGEAAPRVAGDPTLRLILRELRNQRSTGREFSHVRVIAIVLQMIAMLCLLVAFWMGAGPQNLEVFLRWVLTGVLVQLSTIAALLFDR